MGENPRIKPMDQKQRDIRNHEYKRARAAEAMPEDTPAKKKDWKKRFLGKMDTKDWKKLPVNHPIRREMGKKRAALGKK